MGTLLNNIKLLTTGSINQQHIRGLKLYRQKFIGMKSKTILFANSMFPSLKQRFDDMNPKLKHPELYKRVNIGLATYGKDKLHLEEQKQKINKKEKNSELERFARKKELLLNLKDVTEDWKRCTAHRCTHTVRLAECFKIYDHLFNEYAYFNPVTLMEINYKYMDTEYLSPVYYGNLLKPHEANKEPNVKIHSKENDLWTLILVNPDGNLYKNRAELLHWFVGNIPGSDVSKGDVVVDYMQPIPPNGTGYHRYVFVLYKQTERIDYTQMKRDLPSLKLRERTFRNRFFYRQFEDQLSPSGLLWFQADYDLSTSDFYHNELNMKEPSYEYEFSKKYVNKEELYPNATKPFNDYIDLHKDPKDLQQSILLERLQKLNPIKGDIEVLPYPLATLKAPHRNRAIWTYIQRHRYLTGIGKYKEFYRFDNRPPTKRSSVIKDYSAKWEIK